MDPVIEEICRAREVQPHALGRWQRYLRDVIQPKLARLADLEAELNRLTERAADLEALTTAASVGGRRSGR